jgi:hypothetical protein
LHRRSTDPMQETNESQNRDLICVVAFQCSVVQHRGRLCGCVAPHQ